MSDADKARRELINTIDFGMEVQQFLGSNIGQYILQQAIEDREAAVAELVQVSHVNGERILQLQQDVKRADSIQTWLGQAIEAGRAAQSMLIEAENN